MASSSGTHITFVCYVDKVTHMAPTNSLIVICVTPLPATISLGALCGLTPLNKIESLSFLITRVLWHFAEEI